MDREVTRRLARSSGPLYAILADSHSARSAAALARQQLAIDGRCEPIRSNLLRGTHHAELCPLRREHARLDLAQTP
jgi:hypothetical protein